MDNQLDVVLLAEYWDQSMVLLKNTMCWELTDVVYLSHKQHTDTHRSVAATVSDQLPGDLVGEELKRK